MRVLCSLFPSLGGPASLKIQPRLLNDDLMSRIAAAHCELAAAMYFALKEHGIDLFELAGIQLDESEDQPVDSEDERIFKRLMKTIPPPDIKLEGP